MADVGAARRGIATIMVAAVLGSVITYLATTSIETARVISTRPAASLGAFRAQPQTIEPINALSEALLNRVVVARPLDPRLVNIAMMRQATAQGDEQLTDWVSVLSRLGWRDTNSLQNRLYFAALQNDLPTILDIGDALMRRRQLQDYIIPILTLVETEPTLRDDFVTRLADNPNWRNRYLYASGHLRGRDQLVARYYILQELRERRVSIGRAEVDANINALVANGLPELGFDLWRDSRDGTAGPVHDPTFARAAGSFAGGEDAVPFEWQTFTGNGFNAEAYSEDGASALAIQWNGRGVPIFARQRTSAGPGSYTIDVEATPENRRDLGAIGFRLSCESEVVAFRQQQDRPTRYTANNQVACAYPVLEIVGDITGRAVPRQIALQSVRLTPVGSPDGR